MPLAPKSKHEAHAKKKELHFNGDKPTEVEKDIVTRTPVIVEHQIEDKEAAKEAAKAKARQAKYEAFLKSKNMTVGKCITCQKPFQFSCSPKQKDVPKRCKHCNKVKNNTNVHIACVH